MSGKSVATIYAAAFAVLAGKRVYYAAISVEKECRFWWAVAELVCRVRGEIA